MECIDHGKRGNKDGYANTSRDGVTTGLHRFVLADKLGVRIESLRGQVVRHT